MTLEEIKKSTDLWLTPEDVAPIVGCNAQKIRLTAHDNPTLLGFHVTVVGTRVKIWRKKFLEYIGEA